MKTSKLKARSRLGCALGVLSLFICSAAQAQNTETVVVTATRIGTTRADLVGSSLSILTPDQIEVRQTQVVSDVLRDIPGVEVSRTGPVGGLTQIRMRGAEGNHTLVLIDGIKASDPFYGEFDFATLIADDMARIEVLRGQQSALYGSDAIGGVINYITLSGKEAPGLRGHIEGGSFDTFEASARYAGVAQGLDYAVSGAWYTTGGVPDSRFGTRRLGSQNRALAGKFGYDVTPDLHLKAVMRFSNTIADQNEQDFNYGSPTYGYEMDGNGSYKNQALYGLFGIDYAMLDGRWKHSLTVQGVDAIRNGYGNSGYPADQKTSGDHGSRERLSYVSSYMLDSGQWVHTFTGAIDLERENYRNADPTGAADTSKRHTDTVGFVADYNLTWANKLGFGAAVRHDINYRFEDSTTYHVQASYLFDMGLRLHAAAGSGVKNPGIYELFAYSPGTFVGNPALKPEKSQGWEVGVEQYFLDGNAWAGATFFDSLLSDEIITSYVFTSTPPYYYSTPTNATVSSPQRGIEAMAGLRLDKNWSVDLAYTYLHARQNGFAAVRRAPNIGSLNIAWRSDNDRYGAYLTVRYNGDQYDYNYTTSPRSYVLLPSYTLINLGGNWWFTDNLQLYGRVENLADEKYEEVYTFRTPGRAFYAGIRVRM